MPEHDEFDTPELVALRSEIVTDLVSLAYWVQADPVETNKYVDRAEGLVNQLKDLHSKSPTWY